MSGLEIKNDGTSSVSDPALNKQSLIKRHPLEDLLEVSAKTGYQLEDVEFARHMDSVDPLRHLRDEFCYPKMKTLGAGKSYEHTFCLTMLQIRRAKRDNFGNFSTFLHKNIFCNPSFEPSQRDSSNEGSQVNICFH